MTYFPIDGRTDRQIACLTFGDRPDAELTIVCLHGLASSKATWMFVAPQLERHYRVVLLDALGYGDSDKPADSERSIGRDADMLRQLLLAKAWPNVVLMGSSYGGAAILETAASFSNFPHSPIRGIVLLAPAALNFPPPDSVRIASRPFGRLLLLDFYAPEELADRLTRGTFADEAARDPLLMQEYERVLSDRGHRLSATKAAPALFEELRIREQNPERFSKVRVPALMIWGEKDRIVPLSVGQRLVSLLPDVRLVTVENCGHTPQEECPDRVVHETLEFVRALPTHDKASVSPHDTLATK